MVFEMLVFSPLNHLTWLIAQENFIILSHQESNKSDNLLIPGFLDLKCLIKYQSKLMYPPTLDNLHQQQTCIQL
jgi:hypothetical protein